MKYPSTSFDEIGVTAPGGLKRAASTDHMPDPKRARHSSGTVSQSHHIVHDPKRARHSSGTLSQSNHIVHDPKRARHSSGTLSQSNHIVHELEAGVMESFGLQVMNTGLVFAGPVFS